MIIIEDVDLSSNCAKKNIFFQLLLLRWCYSWVDIWNESIDACFLFLFRHVRLWNIPDKRVVYWTLIPAQASSLITAAQANLITAVHFCDEGRKVTVGTFDGRFLLYNDLLQYDVSSIIFMKNSISFLSSDGDEHRW